MNPEVQAYAPYASLALGAVLVAAYFVYAVRQRGLWTRKILFAFATLAIAPSLYVGLTWTGLIPDRYLRFERPQFVVPCSLLVLFVVHRLLDLSLRQHKVRRRLTETLISLSALTLALAVVGIEIGKPLDRLAIIVAIDRSRSIDLVPGAESRINAELRAAETSMREHDRIGTVVFASEAAVEDPLRPRTRMPAPQKVELGRDGTDLGAAIRRALTEVPADSAARIVVLSDGVATRGNPIEAAAAAVAADVPIDVVPLDQRKVPDVRVAGVRLPSRADENEAMALRIVTSSTSDAELEVRVYRDGELIRKGDVSVRAGEDVVRLREKAPAAGLHRYDVEVTAKDAKLDQAPEDNRGSTFVRVRGEASALVMEGDLSKTTPLVQALQSAAFQVSTVSATGVPADVAGFAAHDVVVLSDIAARDLSPAQLDALASYVRDLGGGLILMGGDQSMGPGGYGKTPVEEVSPVSFDLKQERKRASLAEVIIIDYSGSMSASAGKHTKLELANEASARSADLLGAGDSLGVMHVDTKVSWTVKLGPVKDKAAIQKAIRSVRPGGGGIYVDLSLEAAYSALAKEKANLKHVLLFSDGSDAEKKTNAQTLIARAKAQGITTSVISLGRGRDVPALERMSKTGAGRFYLIEDASRLPTVFAQETILAARSAINETTFIPKLSEPGPATRGVDFTQAPALTGYVVTIPKGRAQIALRGPEGDPILGTWSVGIGRSAAFTSDFKDRWGAAWTNWGGAARLFAQVGRDVARRADDPRVRIEADTAGGELHVRATVVDDDGRTESFRRLKVRVGGPEGFKREVALEAVGAGAYAASVPLSMPGAYIATAIDELKGDPVGTTGAVLSTGEELRPTGSDRALLNRIATMTGGKMRENLAGIFRDRVERRFAYRSLTLQLLLWSAFLLLFGVAARRLAVPAWVTGIPRRIAERRKLKQAERALQQPEQPNAAGTVDALRGVKGRSTTERAPEAGPVAPPPVYPTASPAPARPPPVAKPGADAPPPSVPRFARGAPQRRPKAKPGLSAAEILLRKRRGKQ